MTELLDKMLGGHQTDIERILSLPVDTRTPESEEAVELARKWTDHFRVPGGTRELRPVQGLVLEYLADRNVQGAVGAIGVGFGKTLISLLAPRVLGIAPDRTVLIVPAAMRQGLAKEMNINYEHFAIETRIWVLSYAEISMDGNEGLLESLDPDLLICDEAHYLKSRGKSKRANAVIRFLAGRRDCVFLPMSGTLTSNSIKEYAHILEMSLGVGSPAPIPWTELDTWARCIDVNSAMNIAESWQWEKMVPLVEWDQGIDFGHITKLAVADRQRAVREAFYHRFSTAPGIVQTSRSAVQCSLYIEPLSDIAIPGHVYAAMETVERDWRLPQGEEVDDPLALARALRQLALGFYYRWVWPAGEPDRAWLYSRAEWHAAVRKVTRRGAGGMDTSTKVRRAVEGGWGSAELRRAWGQWQAHAHKPEPETEAVWLDTYLIEHAATTCPPHEAIWYSHGAVADKLAEYGVRVVRPGDDIPDVPASGRPTAFSIKSHGIGQNLQAWPEMRILCPPISGMTWEQLIGRLHRPGQPADEVWVRIYAHTAKLQDALYKARESAKYIQATQGQPQKLLYADWVAW